MGYSLNNKSLRSPRRGTDPVPLRQGLKVTPASGRFLVEVGEQPTNNETKYRWKRVPERRNPRGVSTWVGDRGQGKSLRTDLGA